MARKPRFGWLRKPEFPVDGVMSLADHLRELRYRLYISLIAVVVAMIGAAFFYMPLMQLLSAPLHDARAYLAANTDLEIKLTITDVTAPFLLALKVVGLAGLVAASPVWIYQAWAYIVPALVAKEKRMALLFMAAALPLFLLGVVAAYWVLPQGIIVMMQFTPMGMELLNMLELTNFLNLLITMMLIFGLGFLLPVFVVGANILGLVTGVQLKKSRSYVVFGSFVFAAAATPGGDPFSMIMLALPMAALFVAAEYICHANDKRRAKAGMDVVLA